MPIQSRDHEMGWHRAALQEVEIIYLRPKSLLAGPEQHPVLLPGADRNQGRYQSYHLRSRRRPRPRLRLNPNKTAKGLGFSQPFFMPPTRS